MKRYPSWSEKVKERDGHTCVICGAPGVHAHHIKAASYHHDLTFKVDNGVTLCKQCHLIAHKGSFSPMHPGMTARQAYDALTARAADRDVGTLIDRLILGANDHEDLAKEYRSRPASLAPYSDDTPPWPVKDIEIVSGPDSLW